MAKAEEEVSIEGINHSSSHYCQEGRDKGPPHTCPNKETGGTYCHNLSSHPPAMVIAVSCVQFQYKLFRWGVTTLLHVAVAIICMFNGPKHAVIKEMDT